MEESKVQADVVFYKEVVGELNLAGNLEASNKILSIMDQQGIAMDAYLQCGDLFVVALITLEILPRIILLH